MRCSRWVAGRAGGVEEIYGGGLRASTLAREIAKVRYDLDLSHLHLRGVRKSRSLREMLPRADPLRDMTPDEITSFIDGHQWRVAKTMPLRRRTPTWSRRSAGDPDEFEWFVMHIRRHGTVQRFGRVYYTLFQDWPVDGVIHQFWTMGSPLSETIVINRAVKR